MRFRILFASTGFFLAVSAAFPASAEIDRIVRSPRSSGVDNPLFCDGGPALARGTRGTFNVQGAWTDFTSSVSATGGVTGRKTASNARPPWADVLLQAPANATLGLRNVTLSYPAGRDTFQVLVREAPRVTALRPSMPPSAFTQATIDVSGRELPAQMSVSVVPVTSGFEASLRQGGSAGGSVTMQRVRRLSDTRAAIDVQFAEPMDRAVLQVALSGSDGCRGRLSFQSSEPTVIEAAATDNRNFVTQILLDASTRNPRVGSPAVLIVRLRQPAQPPTGLARGGSLPRPGIVRPGTAVAGERVFWRLNPAASFSFQGRALSPTAQQELVIPYGQREGRITVQVTSCPGPVGRGGTTAGALLETWMHDRNAQSAPEHVNFSFNVSCPSN